MLQFSHLENTVGARAAISSTVWFIHITINGLFLQEVCCNGRGSSREPGSGALPAFSCHPWQLCSRQGLLQLPSPSPRSTWPTVLQAPRGWKAWFLPHILFFLQIVELSLFSTLKLWSLHHHPASAVPCKLSNMNTRALVRAEPRTSRKAAYTATQMYEIRLNAFISFQSANLSEKQQLRLRS